MNSTKRDRLYRFFQDNVDAPVFVKVPQLALNEGRPINKLLSHGVYYRVSASDIGKIRPLRSFERNEWMALLLSDKKDEVRRLNALKENSACVGGLDWEWYTLSPIGLYERIV